MLAVPHLYVGVLEGRHKKWGTRHGDLLAEMMTFSPANIGTYYDGEKAIFCDQKLKRTTFYVKRGCSCDRIGYHGIHDQRI